MTLLLRYSTAEHVLRSIADRPGIVSFSDLEDGPTLIVNEAWQPPDVSRPGSLLAAILTGQLVASPDGRGFTAPPRDADASDEARAIDPDEAFAACEGHLEVAVLAKLVAAATAQAVQHYVASLDYDLARRVIDFAEAALRMAGAEAARRGIDLAAPPDPGDA